MTFVWADITFSTMATGVFRPICKRPGTEGAFAFRWLTLLACHGRAGRLCPAPGGLSKNSMPRASSARLTASAVRGIKLSPRSNLLIVEVDTHAVSASSRTPIRKAARAILH